MKKRLVAVVLSTCMLLTMVYFSAMAEGIYTPGTYEGTAQGFGGDVTVTVTVDENAVTAVTVTGKEETAALGGAAIEDYNDSLIGVTSADEVEITSGATLTSTAVKEALEEALSKAASADSSDDYSNMFYGTLIEKCNFTIENCKNDSDKCMMLAAIAILDYIVEVDENFGLDYSKNVYVGEMNGLLNIDVCQKNGNYINLMVADGMPVYAYFDTSSSNASVIEQYLDYSAS